MPNAANNHGHVTLTGIVRKILPPLGDNPEIIEIVLEGAEPLYCEIRIPNTLRTTQGQIIALKPGDRVTLSVESRQTESKDLTSEKYRNGGSDIEGPRA